MSPDREGVTERERLQGLLKRARTAERREELSAALELPPFPRELDYLWSGFLRLRRRQGGGFGPAPIAWLDIDAFSRSSGLKLVGWEVRLMEELDDLYLSGLDIAGSGGWSLDISDRAGS